MSSHTLSCFLSKIRDRRQDDSVQAIFHHCAECLFVIKEIPTDCPANEVVKASQLCNVLALHSLEKNDHLRLHFA
jgi:hypothetical protein